MRCHARISKRWLWLIGLVSAAGLSIFVGAWLACGGVGYLLALRTAEEAYRGSRPDSWAPGSFEFAVRGISCDMTEEEVEHVLSPARTTCPMVMEERIGDKMVKWDGFVRLYICEYGKPWHNPVLGRKRVLVKEWFWVYFDPTGKAKKVLRELHSGPDSEDMVIDLENRTVSGTGN